MVHSRPIGIEMAAALAHWEKIKDLDESKWSPKDEFIALRLKDVFRCFTEKNSDKDLAFFMRNPKSIEMSHGQ